MHLPLNLSIGCFSFRIRNSLGFDATSRLWVPRVYVFFRKCSYNEIWKVWNVKAICMLHNPEFVLIDWLLMIEWKPLLCSLVWLQNFECVMLSTLGSISVTLNWYLLLFLYSLFSVIFFLLQISLLNHQIKALLLH